MIVWEGTLDNQYHVVVVRKADPAGKVVPYEGILTISDGDQTLHQQDVTLSYDARFGPDVADVSDWEQIAISVIDGRKS